MQKGKKIQHVKEYYQQGTRQSLERLMDSEAKKGQQMV
jgi:hypothetical protein